MYTYGEMQNIFYVFVTIYVEMNILIFIKWITYSKAERSDGLAGDT